MGARKARQPADRRAVYVNGVYCPCLAAGARHASGILLREVKLYEIHRAANGIKEIKGIDVTDAKKVKPVIKDIEEITTQHTDKVLLHYPPGENNIQRGLPGIWS